MLRCTTRSGELLCSKALMHASTTAIRTSSILSGLIFIASAMFVAVHGSAPDIAGRGIANPSGLLNAAVQMLVHLGEAPVAERIANAWLTTLESGLHTADLYREGLSEREVTCDEFTDAIIERLGARPERLREARFETRRISVPEPVAPRQPPAPEEAASSPARTSSGWMQRLRRTFGIELGRCPRCAGQVRLIATITDPSVIARILEHSAAREARQSTARGPPLANAARH